jgi:hypothetical protein
VACTDDSCDEVNDVIVNTPNDANCDDGAFCNGAETCDALLGCQAGTPPATDDGVACTDDSCDEVNDVIVNTPNDANCDDGAFCNGAETCDALLGCQAGTPPATDDGVACTADSCDEVNDVVVNAPNDAFCDDGAFCSGNETCDALLGCQAGTDPCSPLACDEVGDICTGCLVDAECDDGLFCTGTETCVANSCVAGTPPTVDDGVACTDDSCDEVNDVVVNAPNDANCDDGAFCNGAETCDALLGCQAGTPPTVDDGVACTDDSCDELNDVVVNLPNDGNCSDGAFCTGTETCDALLGCQAGTDPCSPLACDEGADVCTGCTVDAECNDGQFCTGTETCVANICVPGTPPTTDDGVACTDDSCDELNDVVVNAPNNALCDDATFCNGAETCNALSGCQAGTPPATDDGVACTDDSCDEVNDVVVNAPNNASCDDGAFCTGTETCNALLGCQAGTNPCGVLTCDEVGDVCTGCAVDADCEDGAFCNGTATCVATICVPGTPPTIDDGVTCTADSCDEVNDVVVNAPNNALCTDPLFCNGTETCDAVLGCQAGTPPVVDDGIACTTDSCNEPTDTVLHIPSNAACSDGVFCNGAETCNAGTGCVVGTPLNCSALTGPCSNGICDEATDRCVRVTLNEGLACDDADACTTGEICTAGFCTGGGGVCGDGIADPGCNETCEPTPGVQLCDSQFDEDLDGLIACADPDCCENLVTPSCGADCQVANYCKPILNDPSVVKVRVTQPDFYKIHGRVNVNPATWNPLETGFAIVLSNSSGVIYRSTLAGSDFRVKGVHRYIWRDRSAKNGLGLRNGLETVRMKVSKDVDTGGLFFAHLKVKAYGDFSAAIEPEMTTQVFGVEDTAILTATWEQRRGGWVLRAKDQLIDSGNFQCVTAP